MGEIRDTIIANIVRYIKNSGFEQKEIATSIGVSPQAVSTWMSGKNTPDIETLVRLCVFLKVPLADMFGGDPYAEKKEPAVQEDDGPGEEEFKRMIQRWTPDQKLRYMHALSESLLHEGTLGNTPQEE